MGHCGALVWQRRPGWQGLGPRRVNLALVGPNGSSRTARYAASTRPRATSSLRAAAICSNTGSHSWTRPRKALELAKLPRLPHDAFHGLRRKWATERKHLPDVDVAKAGGWRSVNTMKRSYQAADDAGIMEAIMEPRKLRDHGA